MNVEPLDTSELDIEQQIGRGGEADPGRVAACVAFCGDVPTAELTPGGFEAYIMDKGQERGAMLAAINELMLRARALADHCDRIHAGDRPFGAAFNAKVRLLEATVKRVDESFGAQIRDILALADVIDVDGWSGS